jgi:U4/U6 small nuclear ribonucleoprotein PRP4
MSLRSHVKPIMSLDWSPNGYQMATGSEDNTIRIWDIRASSTIYTIPAHTNVITQVRYWKSNASETASHLNGSVLLSSSYDGTCKLWTDGDYKPLQCLTGVESKVMCCDISSDAKYIVSALYDRTFKLYEADFSTDMQ